MATKKVGKARKSPFEIDKVQIGRLKKRLLDTVETRTLTAVRGDMNEAGLKAIGSAYKEANAALITVLGYLVDTDVPAPDTQPGPAVKE